VSLGKTPVARVCCVPYTLVGASQVSGTGSRLGAITLQVVAQAVAAEIVGSFR
jgi:hypothetical protein